MDGFPEGRDVSEACSPGLAVGGKLQRQLPVKG